MALSKYLKRSSTSGQVEEVLPVVTSAGAADDGKILALDATGRLDSSFMPVGITADTKTYNSSGALSAGDFVYITSAALIARASAATAGFAAMGFVLAASGAGTPATIYFEGRNTVLTGLTPGARYYLSDTTAGGLTLNPVSGSGKTHQFLGYAISATELDFEPDDSIILA